MTPFKKNSKGKEIQTPIRKYFWNEPIIGYFYYKKSGEHRRIHMLDSLHYRLDNFWTTELFGTDLLFCYWIHWTEVVMELNTLATLF